MLHNELRYIKLVVPGISVVSESRNQTAQGIFKKIKLSGEMDSQLTYCGSLCVFLMDKGQIQYCEELYCILIEIRNEFFDLIG